MDFKFINKYYETEINLLNVFFPIKIFFIFID